MVVERTVVVGAEVGAEVDGALVGTDDGPVAVG